MRLSPIAFAVKLVSHTRGREMRLCAQVVVVLEHLQLVGATSVVRDDRSLSIPSVVVEPVEQLNQVSGGVTSKSVWGAS